VNVYDPALLAVVVAAVAPLKDTVEPLPLVLGLIVPERLKLCGFDGGFVVPIALVWLVAEPAQPIIKVTETRKVMLSNKAAAVGLFWAHKQRPGAGTRQRMALFLAASTDFTIGSKTTRLQVLDILVRSPDSVQFRPVPHLASTGL
jgi:hypothetical protein